MRGFLLGGTEVRFFRLALGARMRWFESSSPNKYQSGYGSQAVSKTVGKGSIPLGGA